MSILAVVRRTHNASSLVILQHRCGQTIIRSFVTGIAEEIPQETSGFETSRGAHQHSVQRGRKERKDSVNEDILLDREMHLRRLSDVPENIELVQRLASLGLGDRKRRRGVYALTANSKAVGTVEDKNTLTGAGGFALHLTSSSGESNSPKSNGAVHNRFPVAVSNWPLFSHLLPEIAFAGHSNTGKVKKAKSIKRVLFVQILVFFLIQLHLALTKHIDKLYLLHVKCIQSTLVNAVSGLLPRKGPASVSDRAGWTDQICFFKVCLLVCLLVCSIGYFYFHDFL